MSQVAIQENPTCKWGPPCTAHRAPGEAYCTEHSKFRKPVDAEFFCAGCRHIMLMRKLCCPGVTPMLIEAKSIVRDSSGTIIECTPYVYYQPR